MELRSGQAYMVVYLVLFANRQVSCTITVISILLYIIDGVRMVS